MTLQTNNGFVVVMHTGMDAMNFRRVQECSIFRAIDGLDRKCR